ncbi:MULTISPECIES: FG-GAP repeat protein [Nostoc]|uniref:FG-GAP repeat protein n=1 Tax=Nostoc paludosum FACHB-159 TaxID=2692908 RepID=A0ABR8KJ38_9NOSO|nr:MULTISPECIES: FG-GAP repeat protein [Nostoc]MBD2683273.1 FG-GAP repeat protein [Nostoc sp. FACHB-857]MBD2739588.1 FG-GAP repeat protein [Nostoc paludosum FACHB-159]
MNSTTSPCLELKLKSVPLGLEEGRFCEVKSGKGLSIELRISAIELTLSNTGLTSAGNQLWHQDSPGIEGVANASDGFGSSLKAGDFNNDGFADLAIGVPGEDVGLISNAGTVNILYGSATGLTA